MAQQSFPLPPPDLTRVLEAHLASAFPPAVAVDLVLSELVVRAVESTLASSGALALLQGDEMVCRAATGALAPCLGAQLSISRGLSGACVRTGQAQSCRDTETDSRVDSDELRGLGIRSMLAVPVFDEWKQENPGDDSNALVVEGRNQGSHPQVIGVLEVCSPAPDAFSPVFQNILERFAQEASDVRRAAAQLNTQDLGSPSAPRESSLLHSFDSLPDEPTNDHRDDPPARRQPYEAWTLILGALVIFAAGGISFMFGTRVGWLGHHTARPPAATETAEITDAAASAAAPDEPQRQSAKVPSAARARQKQGNKPQRASSENTAPPSSSDLVVYEKGKVIFRMKSPAPGSQAVGAPPSASPASGSTQATGSGDNVAQGSVRSAATPIGSAIVPAASNTRTTAPRPLWLSPQDSQARLITRTEPAYPVDALAARRSGEVVLEVKVAEDGSVSSARVLRGDLLFSPAAIDAVRGWRYQPYISNGQPVPFETSVTVSFSLPE
jgi:TonB family protein